MLDGENKLITDAINGEASAFGFLYSKYQPQIYRFILLKVSQREEAEDLTHQVFLSAWHGIPRYKPREHPFHSWLYKIARNKVIDHYRSKKETQSLENLESHADNSSKSLESAFEVKNNALKIRQALKLISERDAEVITLRFIEELSIKETSQIMNISEANIRVIQHRAIKELQIILDNKTNEHLV